MKIELLDSKEQFKNLKKGELILVKWSDNWVRHTPRSKNVMFYNVYDNKHDQEEIICQRKDNHYFNYDRYLQGLSGALEVYRVIEYERVEGDSNS